MNNVYNVLKCTGCGLCSNLCPKHAISICARGKKGHFVPIINPDICIECGLCKKKCPAINDSCGNKEHITYAAWKEDINSIGNSSSGGVAACLYEHALKNDFYIVGAYLDSDFGVKLKLTNNIDDIEIFKSSKYEQAFPGNIYNEISETIERGHRILFIGTPCLCAAARAALNEHQKEYLITAEIICHGVPSQKMFQEYIRCIETRKHARVDSVSFRSERGADLTMKTGTRIVWKGKDDEDEFMNAFQNGISINEACYYCNYATTERKSDIVIGDFWKIGTLVPFNSPGCRVSALSVFTEKGECFINSCAGLHLEQRSFSELAYGNPNLIHPSTKHPMADTFAKMYGNVKLEKIFEEIVGNNLKKRRVKNKLKSILKRITDGTNVEKIVR